MIRKSNKDVSQNFSIPSDLTEVRKVQLIIEPHLRTFQFGEREIFHINLALEEAIVNAIKYGNRLDPSKKVQISFQINAEHFEVVIVDEGPGFNPHSVPDCLAPENLEKPGGRGLFLMKHYMNEVTFHPPGNRVSMSKVRQKECQ